MQDRKKLLGKCNEIAHKIVNKSFPELKDDKFILFYIWKYFDARAFAFSVFSVHFIGFTRKFVKLRLSNKALKGLIAHEVSHIARFKEMGFSQRIGLAVGYYLSKKVYAREEISNDNNIIRLGYAKERYSLAKESEIKSSFKQLQKKRKRGYRSGEEIKNYAKSIGKW